MLSIILKVSLIIVEFLEKTFDIVADEMRSMAYSIYRCKQNRHLCKKRDDKRKSRD